MVKLPYVQRFKDRAGKWRYYFRKRGLPRVALPDPSNKAAFVKAYTAASKADPAPLRTHAEATIAALLAEYKGSPEWHSLKPASRYAYGRIIRWLEDQPNVLPSKIAHVKRRNILALRDKLLSKPATANLTLWFLQRLMSFAVDREYRDDNPALKIPALPTGEYRSWTDEELEQFRKSWKRGTTERFVFELALYTGQRRGDIAKMTWADVKDDAIYVCQEKTGAKLWIPCHPSLADEVGRAKRVHAVLLSTDTGRPFRPAYLGAIFAKAISHAGLPDACVLHGLRKAAARRLAEAGCSDREIMSITGHKSVEMVSHYTRQADQKRLASGAIVRLDQERPVSNVVKPTT